MAVQVKVTGIEAELARVDEELIELANQSLRARLFQTIAELKATTPVDTGRARNSWLVTNNPNSFLKSGGNSGAVGLLNAPSKEFLEEWYITNGVPYIADLNAGSSNQAPARFIENTVLKYFEIQGLAYVSL